MIQIKVFKGGELKFGPIREYSTLEDANIYITEITTKPSHPWGRNAGWYPLISENTVKVYGKEEIILPEEILERRPIVYGNDPFEVRTASEEVRLDANYVIEIIDLDKHDFQLPVIELLRDPMLQNDGVMLSLRYNFNEQMVDTKYVYDTFDFYYPLPLAISPGIESVNYYISSNMETLVLHAQDLKAQKDSMVI